eukprot:365994-Chlamydomonas_euryale.AAC.13
MMTVCMPWTSGAYPPCAGAVASSPAAVAPSAEVDAYAMHGCRAVPHAATTSSHTSSTAARWRRRDALSGRAASAGI